MAAAARTPKAFPSGEGNLLPYDLAAVLPKFVAAVINRHHLKEVAIDNRRYIFVSAVICSGGYQRPLS